MNDEIDKKSFAKIDQISEWSSNFLKIHEQKKNEKNSGILLENFSRLEIYFCVLLWNKRTSNFEMRLRNA